MEIIVIGGGAAGFFAAIAAAQNSSNAKVILLEKTEKLLTKVRVSGGGRCNVTHACFENSLLVKSYPRGEKELRNVFSRFSTLDTLKWFEERGVKLKTEADGRMFPLTDNSETIIQCLKSEATRLNIQIICGSEVTGIIKKNERFSLLLKNQKEFLTDKVIIASGGSPKTEGYRFLLQLGHKLISPVPSLFTFNIPDNSITGLMGISIPFAKIKIEGTKLESEGPLLITHWGLSGPAVLKASAWGARILHDLQYKFSVHISWVPQFTEEKLRIIFRENKTEMATRIIAATPLFELPRRLWTFLLQKAGISEELRWGDLSKKLTHLLVSKLINDDYKVSGKTTFKEEFVTCGGVSLKEIELSTMESKIVKGLYFAGEVMDVDGITGGFNFQNAWSSGWLAGVNSSKK